MRRIPVRGVHYNLAVDGSGPPLLMLHGFTGSMATWSGVMETFARHFTVVRIDLLGHGNSDSPTDPMRYAMDEVVVDLLEIADRLAFGRFHLLGYSMGGRLALHVALANQQRVRTLVLAGASPGIESPKERAARRRADAELARFIEEEGIEAFVERWESLPLFSTERSLPEAVRRRVRAERLNQSPRGLANSLRGAGTGSQGFLLGAMAQLKVPTLLLAGEFDDKYTAWAHRMGAVLPRAQVVIVEGAGHAVHRERPELFVNAVVPYLQDVEGEPDEY